MPRTQNVMPVRYEAEDLGYSVIVRPVFPQGAKKTRGDGQVRNAIRDAAAKAAGLEGKVGDLSRADQAKLMQKVTFLPDFSIQVVKKENDEAVKIASDVAEAGENYHSLFASAMQTAEDYATNAPENQAANLIGRFIRALLTREASPEEATRLLRETLVPEMQSRLETLATDDAFVGKAIKDAQDRANANEGENEGDEE